MFETFARRRALVNGVTLNAVVGGDGPPLLLHGYPQTTRCGTNEDYRAAASVDLAHDAADRRRKLTCPVLALWGEQGVVHRGYDVLAVWRDYAADLRGEPVPGAGHFLVEERSARTLRALLEFPT